MNSITTNFYDYVTSLRSPRRSLPILPDPHPHGQRTPPPPLLPGVHQPSPPVNRPYLPAGVHLQAGGHDPPKSIRGVQDCARVGTWSIGKEATEYGPHSRYPWFTAQHLPRLQ